MHRQIIAISAVVLALGLAGCGRKHPPMPTHGFVNPGVTLKLDPAEAPDCKPTSTYVATVSWSVNSLNTPKTEVLINGPEGQSFARSNDRTAKKDTGKWVAPGLWFVLLDRRSGEMLGAVQAGPKPCP
ncbi:MAG TPA: lipoprotein [Xanthomonadaceae bacterium]|jgi:hypothetical protein|nr:lipoprotein [Xanthomonadaceae bacterium]